MIPKSGSRFSEMIMRKQIIATTSGCDVSAIARAAAGPLARGSELG